MFKLVCCMSTCCLALPCTRSNILFNVRSATCAYCAPSFVPVLAYSLVTCANSANICSDFSACAVSIARTGGLFSMLVAIFRSVLSFVVGDTLYTALIASAFVEVGFFIRYSIYALSFPVSGLCLSSCVLSFMVSVYHYITATFPQARPLLYATFSLFITFCY